MGDELLVAFFELPDDEIDKWLEAHREQLSRELVAAGKAKAEEIAYGGDLDGALRILEHAFMVAEALAEPLAEALVWRARANVLQFHERYAESLTASDRAVALYEQHGTPFDVAVARTVEVNTLGALERFDEAIDLAKWIRLHFESEGFTLGQAYLASNLAQVYTWAWRLEEAWPENLKARELYLQLQMFFDATKVLHDMGVLAYRMDQLDLARHYYSEAYPELEAAGNLFMMIKIQFNLAEICLRQGQYEMALEHLAQAYAQQVRLPDSRRSGKVDLLEAQARWCLNQTSQAEKLLREALDHFNKLGRRLYAAQTLIALGHLLAADGTLDKLGQGLSYLEQAEAYLRPLRISLFVAWVQLEQAELLLRLGQTKEAASRAEEANAVFAGAGLRLRQAQTSLLLADCTWRLQPHKAQKWYDFALDVVGEDVPLLAVRAWRGKARLAADRGDGDEAEQAYEQAVNLLDTVRGQLHGHSHQAGFLESSQAHILEDELVATLHQQVGHERQVLTWVERFKARALADLLAEQPPDKNADPELIKLRQERERLCGQRDRRTWTVGTASDAGMARSAASLVAHDSYQAQELARIRQELQKIDEQIARLRDPTYAWREATVIDPASVHGLLDEQSVLISYYTVAGELYALTATQSEGDLQIHPLYIKLADIEEHLEQSRRQIIRSTGRAKLKRVQARLAQWWRSLISPLEHRLRDKSRLLILPHRSLFHIPFAALYNKKEQHYLIEQWTVQLAPSATVLAHCQQRGRRTGVPLLVGYPGQPSQPGYLPSVKREIDTLAALLPKATILYGDAATEAAVMAQMSSHSYIHLAGHAFYDNTHPLESGMPLAGGRWLRADTLYTHHNLLDGALVVLSGCDSGRGRPTGNDVLGLTSAFLYAGARGIVAGLWRVDDQATAELMIAFQRELRDGAATAAALRLAQLELLGSKEYAAPYFWAPWALSGAG